VAPHRGHSLNANPRAVAKNAATGYATLTLGALLGFVVTPILYHNLGVATYGTWSLVLAATGYLGLLDLGLGTATMTRAAALESQGSAALGPLLSTSLALFSAIAIAGLMLVFGASVVFPRLFGVAQHLETPARVAFVLVGASQCLAAVTGGYSALLLGTGRMYIVNISGVTLSALVTVAQALIAIRGGTIAELGAAQLGGGALMLGVFHAQVRRALPGVEVAIRTVDTDVARRLLALGWRNAISSLAGTLAFGSDVVLVGLLLNPVAAAGYAIAQRGSVLVTRLTTGVLGAIGPSHAYAAANTGPERRFDLFCAVLTLTMMLAILFGATVGVYATPLLHLWVGTYPASTALVVIILCAVVIIQAPGANSAVLLTMSEQATDVMRVSVAAATLNVIASVIFTLALGTIGPALGSLVAVSVFDAVYFPLRVCALLGQSYRHLVSRVVAPLLRPVLVFAVLLAAGRLISPPGPWVLLVCAVAGLGFCGALWMTEPVRGVRRTLSSRQ
jgi:O-antigen/teichoic acid export membrane protein